MKAEIQFFMSATDAAAFISRAEPLIDSIDERNESTRLIIGDCDIIYTPSLMVDNTLMVGSMAIDSGGSNGGCSQHLRANKVYKNLRKWVKNNYYSRLCSWTEEKGSKKTSSRTRDFWLGPDAKQTMESNNDMELRLSSSSLMVFDLAPEMNIMGEIKPKIGRKKK